MVVLDFEAYAKCRDEIKEHKKIIDNLMKMNAELEEKVNAIYGAYETLQYTCEGRCSLYGSELERLRKQIEQLQNELDKQTE
jgi:chromosome segregation ATPase